MAVHNRLSQAHDYDELNIHIRQTRAPNSHFAVGKLFTLLHLLFFCSKRYEILFDCSYKFNTTLSSLRSVQNYSYSQLFGGNGAF